MNYEVLGQTIKAIRQTNGYSQSEFAQIYEINQSTVSRLENGDENISLDLYEKCLNIVNISLMKDNPEIPRLFRSLLDTVLDNVVNKELVISFYDNMKAIGTYSLKDYFYVKIAEIFLLTYLDKYDEIVSKTDYLSQFTFVFDRKLEMYYDMTQAYAKLHNQKQDEAVKWFSKAFEIMIELNIKEPILLLVYSLNNIGVRRFAVGQIYLNTILEMYQDKSESYAYYTVLKNLGTLYLLDGNYKEALPPLLQFYNNKKYLNSPSYFPLQMDSFIGLCYLQLGNYEEASHYFKHTIENPAVESLLDAFYYYMLFIQREKQDYEAYSHYLDRFKQQTVYENTLVRKIHHYFFEFDGPKLDELVKDFKTMFEQIFSNSHKYAFTKNMFSLYGEELWKKRSYKNYKALYDVMIKQKFGFLDYCL